MEPFVFPDLNELILILLQWFDLLAERCKETVITYKTDWVRRARLFFAAF